MQQSRTLLALLIASAMVPAVASALDLSVPFINADQSRILLGDGTGVIVGIIDSGVDDTHPGLTGMDSLGQPRLVAEGNFVPTEPGNTGDDVHGHGTAVAGVSVGSLASHQGLAPDARYVNARVLDSFNGFDTSVWVRNGVGFALENDADILNLSLNFFSPVASGTSQLDLMLDWAVGQGHHVAACAGNIGQGAGYPSVRGPGSLYNGVSVGRTNFDFQRVHPDSAGAFTQDGRMKPDLVAPGTSITTYNDDWETASDLVVFSGCSFATPHMAGLMAQQLDYGFANGLSTNPLVIKSTLANSAQRVNDRTGDPWEPANLMVAGGVATVTQPLDTDAGAGQIDGLALFNQYSAGEHDAGLVPDVGWALQSIEDQGAVDFQIQVPLPAGAQLNVSLAWLRHVMRIDDGNGVIDAADTFSQVSPLDNLDVQILRDGVTIAESISAVDNLEHLKFNIEIAGDYTVRVLGSSVVGGVDEQFAVAWQTSSLPGDFDQDDQFACDDVDALVAEIVAMTHDPTFDMTGDLLVDRDDLEQWLATAGSINNSSGMPYLPGDITLDGTVDAQDFIVWNDHKFTLQSAWCAGDLNADGAVDGQDFVLWNDSKFLSARTNLVPEPAACCLLLWGATLGWRPLRQRP